MTAQFCSFCTDVQILRIIWEALSLWTNRGRPHPTHKSGGLMSRPLPSWTPAQAIQVQRKYVSYYISPTQCFLSPWQTWLFDLSHSDVLLLLGGNLHEWRWLFTALYLHLWVYHSTLNMLFIFGVFNLSCVLPQASEGERPRREATSQPHQLQLVSLGPLQLVQNNTEAEEDPCMKQEKSKSSKAPN